MGWQDVRLRRAEITHPAIKRFLDCVSLTHVNGGAILACLAADDPTVFDHVNGLQMLGLDHSFVTFLGSPSVVSALPELKIDASRLDSLKLAYMSPLGMEGELTHLLLCGGAYRKFDGTIEEARTVTRDFVSAVVDGNYLRAMVAVSHEAWSEWFFDIAWDHTYLLCNPEARNFWLLCITDTD